MSSPSGSIPSGSQSIIRRGEIYWVDWNPARGSEQAGRRPALIVGTDAGNANARYPNTIVAAISTSGRPIATHVPLTPSARNGLAAPSFVKCEQLVTISKDRLGARIGHIEAQELSQINAALRHSLDLF